MALKVTLIFDIGRTNKKVFLFDKNFQEVYRDYIQFDEIKDEDGYPTENLEALEAWMFRTFNEIMDHGDYDIEAINFSAYGATMVHLDSDGNPLTPLYNYTKPLADDIVHPFFEKYGPEIEFLAATGSDNSGMLNSGMQLYWIKRTKPKVFEKIQHTLHLPQYLSYLFTELPITEYTSCGSHTILWDYTKKDYHAWVYKEGLDTMLSLPIATNKSFVKTFNGKKIKVGVGIHDSSSALLTYLKNIRKKFILVSTGTMSVTLNPFPEHTLSREDIQNDCINYMQIEGSPVKASRLFLGNEYKLQVKELASYYNVPIEKHKGMKFNFWLFSGLMESFQHRFCWKGMISDQMPKKTSLPFASYEEAYHQLIIELVLLQVKAINDVRENSPIKRLYVDGGFSDNEVFIKLLSHFLKDMELRTANSSLGSALGAAIVISTQKLQPKFLKRNYRLRKHRPFSQS